MARGQCSASIGQGHVIPVGSDEIGPGGVGAPPGQAQQEEPLMSKAKATPGIDVRHRKQCRGARADGKCCNPSYQAHVFDKRTNRRIRKTFGTKSAAKLWRQDAITALRYG